MIIKLFPASRESIEKLPWFGTTLAKGLLRPNPIDSGVKCLFTAHLAHPRCISQSKMVAAAEALKDSALPIMGITTFL